MARYFGTDDICRAILTLTGILYANLAIINPAASWDFFSQPNFDPTWLDGGASLTWYLTFAAGELQRISCALRLWLLTFDRTGRSTLLSALILRQATNSCFDIGIARGGDRGI